MHLKIAKLPFHNSKQYNFIKSIIPHNVSAKIII